MKNSDLKYTIIGFLGGILATVVTGFFNFEINRQNKLHDEKMEDREERDLIVNELAEFQLAYEHLKYDFRNNVRCDTTNKHYSEASVATIKLLGNQQVSLTNKSTMIDLISELSFIATNYCEQWKLFNNKNNPVVSVMIDGKVVEGFLFEGNLRTTDSLSATLYSNLFLKR